MRPLKSTFPSDALTTLGTLLKQTPEARIFRRVQAVQAVVAGTPITTVSSTFRFADSALRKWVQRFATHGVLGFRERPRAGRPPKVTPEVSTRLSQLIQHDPLHHGVLASQWSCRDLATTLATETGVHLGRESIRRALKKKAIRYCRPTGRLAPNPAELAYGRLEVAALEYRAQRGELILLYADETVLWRLALPRAGWWHQTTRYRLPLRPLTRSQINRAEASKRHAWQQQQAWARITDGVLLTLMGAVQYGTSKVFYKLVPHFDALAFRQYLHQLMATFGPTGKEVVLVVERRGIHRAHKLTPTLERWAGRLRLHFLPAHSGHHLNPIEGFWRVLKTTVGAGRSFGTLRALYQRTRQVLMAHQQHPIYQFRW